jgi:hypothetical protein
MTGVHDQSNSDDAVSLHATKFGVASAVAFSILWLICSAIVALAPDPMIAVTGHMVHADFGELAWTLNWAGVLEGAI